MAELGPVYDVGLAFFLVYASSRDHMDDLAATASLPGGRSGQIHEPMGGAPVRRFALHTGGWGLGLRLGSISGSPAAAHKDAALSSKHLLWGAALQVGILSTTIQVYTDVTILTIIGLKTSFGSWETA